MAQSDYNILNSSGAVFRQRVNEVNAAVKSSNSGASSPSDPVAGMFWYDATAGVLKQRNQANDAWINAGGNYAARPFITANTTLTAAAHAGRYIIIGGSGPTLDLPLASTMPAGTTITVHNYSIAAASIARQGSDTISVYGQSLTSLSIPIQGMVTFVSDATGVWVPHGHALYALGMGDSYQNVTASRAVGVTYTNTSGRPIFVSAWFVAATETIPTLLIGGEEASVNKASNAGDFAMVCGVVGPGETYRINAATAPSTFAWSERRL